MFLLKKSYFLFLMFISTCTLWVVVQSLGFFNLTLCPLKLLTGIPCPGCGTTRAVFAMLNGDVIQALMINPIGLLFSAGILLASGIMIYDLFFKKVLLEKLFERTQTALKSRIIFRSVLFLISINWVCNISKGL